MYVSCHSHQGSTRGWGSRWWASRTARNLPSGLCFDRGATGRQALETHPRRFPVLGFCSLPCRATVILFEAVLLKYLTRGVFFFTINKHHWRRRPSWYRLLTSMVLVLKYFMKQQPDGVQSNTAQDRIHALLLNSIIHGQTPWDFREHWCVVQTFHPTLGVR